MTSSVFVISEWLPRENGYEKALQKFKELAGITLKNESGCLKYKVTEQITHPNAAGQTQYPIILIQEYKTIEDFEKHCQADYVAEFANTYLVNEETSLIADWRCRLVAQSF